jgi:beta-glucanase (GH16 family)
MFNKLKGLAKEQLDKQLDKHQQPQQQHPSSQGAGGHDQAPVQPPSQRYWEAKWDLINGWRHETGSSGWGNAELQDYTNDQRNAHVEGSTLVIKAIVEPGRITSARLTSHKTLERDRGYLMARITAPSAKGVWPAFWMLPKEPFSWPTDGEVDIMESWNGLPANHSCLHWGQYNGEDHDKHRVIDTNVNEVSHPQGHTYGFAWDENSRKLAWYIDDRPVMRCEIPREMGRKLKDFQIKLNIATGGNVMQGTRPDDGVYEMRVHEMGLYEAPPGGWEHFEREYGRIQEGHGY